MITSRIFGVTDRQTGAYFNLGPYNAMDLAHAVPILPALVQHQRQANHWVYTSSDPSDFIAHEEKLLQSETWGIFAPLPTRPSGFVGTIQLTQTSLPDTLEVGRQLFLPEARGMGLGTLALLAVAQIAFEEGCATIRSHTSPANEVVKRSLAKAGFRWVGSLQAGRGDTEPTTFMDGSVRIGQLRHLMTPTAIAAHRLRPERTTLLAGWQVFETAAANTDVLSY